MKWKENYQNACKFLYKSILFYKPDVFMSKLNTSNMGKKVKKDKDALAREKVDQLLADVTVNKEDKSNSEETDAIVVRQKANSTEWMELQISELTEKNEQLEKELTDAKDSFKKLSADFVAFRKKGGSSSAPSDSVFKQKIVKLFTKFEDAYLGRNPSRERFTHIKLVNPPNNTGLLDEFIKEFGDILKKK